MESTRTDHDPFGMATGGSTSAVDPAIILCMRKLRAGDSDASASDCRTDWPAVSTDMTKVFDSVLADSFHGYRQTYGLYGAGRSHAAWLFSQ